jgi:hypothetical protein
MNASSQVDESRKRFRHGRGWENMRQLMAGWQDITCTSEKDDDRNKRSVFFGDLFPRYWEWFNLVWN